MKKTLKKILTLVLSAAVLLSTLMCAIPVTAAKADSATDFMAGKYGIMLHYLPAGSADWNQTVSDFDVTEFAKNANNVGASWVIFTLTQRDGQYCVPMTEFADIFGGDYGTDRDLVEDLYNALNPYGIKLMLYWIPGAPAGTGEVATSIAEKLGATERRVNSSTDDWMLNQDVIDNMSTVMEGLSLRYGEKIAGWWLDACYDGIGFNNTYAEQLAAALRAGNSDAAVAFNNGTSYGDCRFESESYAAGEICNHGTLDTVSIYDYSATSRWTENGFQKHYLTFLGTNWRASDERYVTEELVEHAYNNILKNGGALTFDVGYSNSGKIDAEQYNQLVALNKKCNVANNLSIDFEDGNNPLAWVSNVYSNADHYSNDSAYVQLAYGEDALNGEASLKVLPPEGNARTDVIAAITSPSDEDTPVKMFFDGNANFDKADAANGFDKVSGIMLRLKLTNDGDKSHVFRFIVHQNGLAQPTNLARNAKLYAADGTYLGTATSADAGLSGTIPAGFDGFVFMPFAESRSGSIINGVGYGNYTATPDVMVDFSKEFQVMMWLNGADYNNSTVLMDDINFYYGNTDADAWDTMRSLGYNVIFKEQPEVYTLPIDNENLWMPVSSAYVTASTGARHNATLATLTYAENEVLSGKYSTKIASNAQAVGVTKLVKLTTVPFAVSGIPMLSAEKIKAAASDSYAYFKIRIKNPQSASVQFVPAIKQGSSYWAFPRGVKAYNVDGTAASVSSNYSYVTVPAGFNGYLYLPLYAMETATFNAGDCNLIVGNNYAYQNADLTPPDLDKDFEIFFQFIDWGGLLNDSVFYMDDIDIITTNNDLPKTFENPVQGFAEFKRIMGSNPWTQQVITKNTVYVGEEYALNGKASTRVTVSTPVIEGNSYAYSWLYTSLNGNADFDVTDFSKANGIMMRLKLENDTGAASAYTLIAALTQSGRTETYVGRDAVLYDLDGNCLGKVTNSGHGAAIPAKFDGFVFMPFSSARTANATDPGTYDNYGNYPQKLVDVASPYTLNLRFMGNNWDGITVALDDMNYYSVSDAATGLTDADAWKAIKGLGYKIYKAEQPASYTIPLDFEGCETPFTTLSTVYNKNTVVPGLSQWHQEKNTVELVTGTDALEGDVSLKLAFKSNAALNEAGVTVARGVTSDSVVNGIEGLTKEFLGKASKDDAYLKLRIKTPATSGTYTFRVVLSQDGLSHTTNLGNSAFGYSKDGTYVAISSHDLNCFLPGGFDGTVYLPLATAMADPDFGVGLRAKYSTMPEYMVDMSKEFKMSLQFWGAEVADSTFIVDDFSVETNTPGDINGDESADSSDLIIMKKQLLGVDTAYEAKCDLNGDKVVNILDFIRLKNIIG
ncbi:MAG: dockerin type I repeat-containing protein [Clostridia bacterium]|nr:dockerin type I repeat-containing protein [Clostridia bacterium]